MQSNSWVVIERINFSVCLSILLSAGVLFYPSPSLVAGTDSSNSSVIDELREIKASLMKESSPSYWLDTLDTILSVAAVVVAIFLFWLDQDTRRRRTIQRSCDTLQRELEMADESFQNDLNRVRYSYFERSALSDIAVFRQINYNRAIIIIDAYDTVLHSAFFTEFSPATQTILSTYYDRVKMHNRLIHLISQLDGPTQKEIEYQLYLTKLESEIIGGLLDSIEGVKSEKLNSMRRHRLSKLKKIVRLKGNLDHLAAYGG